MRRSVAISLVFLLGFTAVCAAQASTISGSHGGGSVSGSGAGTASGGIVGVVSSGSGEPGIGAGADPCRYQVGSAAEIGDLILGHLPGSPSGAGGGGSGEDDADGEGSTEEERPWVLVTCPTSYSGAAIDDLFQLGDAPPAAGMLEAARRALVIPLPEPMFSPAADAFQVVGIETWVWIDEADAAPLTATACIPPADYACSTVVASFVTIGVDMGDGTPAIDCAGPGVPFDVATWEPGADLGQCDHVYIDPPAEGLTYPVEVTSVWSMTWSCAYDADLDGFRESSCGGGPLPPVGRIGDPVDLEVREYQAVATIAE